MRCSQQQRQLIWQHLLLLLLVVVVYEKHPKTSTKKDKAGDVQNPLHPHIHPSMRVLVHLPTTVHTCSRLVYEHQDRFEA